MAQTAKIRDVINGYLGKAAKAHPVKRPQILREGAALLAQAAGDPRNKHHKAHLTSIGLELVGAAMKAQQALQPQPQWEEPQQRQHFTMTDFEDLLSQTREAVEQLPENGFYPSAALDVLALRGATGGSPEGGSGDLSSPGASAGAGASATASPRVSIAPASFNANSTLGRAVTVTFAPTPAQTAQGISQSQTAAFWQGVKEESQAMSVDVGTVLQPTPPEHFGAGPTSRPFAVIQYGADGNTQNVIPIDVGQGRRLTVIGNYISVLLGMDPPPVNRTSAVLTMGASIAAFAATSEAPVTRTVYFDSLDPMSNTPFHAVPLRATTLLVPCPGTGFGGVYIGTLDIHFFDITGHVVTSWHYDFTTGFGLIPIQVPTDAYFFNVFPSLAGSFRLPFQLSL